MQDLQLVIPVFIRSHMKLSHVWWRRFNYLSRHIQCFYRI